MSENSNPSDGSRRTALALTAAAGAVGGVQGLSTPRPGVASGTAAVGVGAAAETATGAMATAAG